MGRAAGRAPGQAQLQRAALGRSAAARRWPTSGSRCTACRSSSGRTVSYARVDPEESRELFIRTRWSRATGTPTTGSSTTTAALVERLTELEHRARRRDILVDDETLVAFYDERLPADVVSARHFDSWWKKASREQPDLLTFTEDLLVSDDAGAVSAEDYPQVWQQGELRPAGDLPVRARAPRPTASPCTSRSTCSTRSSTSGSTGRCPGCAQDLVTALLKSLPKATRRHFVPTPDHAQAALADSDPAGGAWITDELGRALKARTGFGVDPGEWDWSRVPDHLRITFRVEDRGGGRWPRARTCAALQDRLAPQMRQTMAQAAGAVERKGLSQWSFGALPATFEQRRGERVIQGFPALVDHGDSVSVEVLPTQSERDHATRLGVRRLLLLNTTAPWKRVLALLSNAQKLALGNNPHGSVPALLDDCLACAVDSIVAERPGGSVLHARGLRGDPRRRCAAASWPGCSRSSSSWSRCWSGPARSSWARPR